MRAFTRDYLLRHALFEDTEQYVQTVVDFMRFCTPRGASRDGLAAACMYGAWVLFLDDDATRARFVDAAAAYVQGQPSEPHPAIVEIVAAGRNLAAVRGLGAEEFLERLNAMMRSQQREHAQTALYSYDRPETIGSRGFISLMKLDAGIDLRLLDPLAQARARLLEELANRVVYLSNDIRSSHREQHDPAALSIVRVLADERRLPWADAVHEAVAVFDDAMQAYLRLRDELRGHRLIRITDAAAAGHLAAMECIGSRYRRDEG